MSGALPTCANKLCPIFPFAATWPKALSSMGVRPEGSCHRQQVWFWALRPPQSKPDDSHLVGGWRLRLARSHGPPHSAPKTIQVATANNIWKNWPKANFSKKIAQQHRLPLQFWPNFALLCPPEPAGLPTGLWKVLFFSPPTPKIGGLGPGFGLQDPSAPHSRFRVFRSGYATQTHTHTHAHAHTDTHPHTHARARTRTRTHPPTHARTYTHTRARTHPHTPTHTRARTYTHAQALNQLSTLRNMASWGAVRSDVRHPTGYKLFLGPGGDPHYPASPVYGWCASYCAGIARAVP